MSLGTGQPPGTCRRRSPTRWRTAWSWSRPRATRRPGPGFTPYSYPAAFTGVISVAAVNGAGKRASFSDRNSSVVMSAPGVSIVGAGPGGTYLQASGTSPASAFVAGVAALIRSAYPQLSPAQVMQALVSSARRRPAAGYSPRPGSARSTRWPRCVPRGGWRRPGLPPGWPPAATSAAARPGPIQVIHRDAGRIAVLAGVAAAGTAGVLIALRC